MPQRARIRRALRSPARSTALGLTVLCLATVVGGILLVGNSGSVPETSFVRGQVRVWVIPYRSHTGRERLAYLLLPSWYGLQRHPALPLVISPHGRQARAQANSVLWGNLPEIGRFAVVNPEGQGRVMGNESWGDPGQIADLAHMPDMLERELPWLRLDRRRIYAIGGSMGGQETLLLLARYPRLLAGAAAFDSPTDLTARYFALARLRKGSYLQGLMRREVGGTPSTAPRSYAARSPIHFAARIAFTNVPVELWWSRRDRIVVDQRDQSGGLYRLIKRLNPDARVREVVGDWSHTAEMTSSRDLPKALQWLGLLPHRLPRQRSPTSQIPAATRRLIRNPASPCDRPHSTALEYHWPIRPFNRQHPIRGYFGDPRTLGRERLGHDHAGSAGSFTFHNGVDIVAPGGTPVYPVLSGVAHLLSGDSVTVTSPDARTFQYFHVKPAVQSGQPVTAYRTVLGRIQPIWQHLHLAEIDGFVVHNPLDPGHLEPYSDHTIPTVDGLSFATAAGTTLTRRNLHGSVRIAADAEDVPALPVPGHWLDFPVTPALVTWRLSSRTRLWLERTVADFRHTEPPTGGFWQVYAAGAYQNFPDFAHHLYWHLPGRYLFNLTTAPLNTRRLDDGIYRITVNVADTCGNHSSLSEQIRIENHHPPVGRQAAPPRPARPGTQNRRPRKAR